LPRLSASDRKRFIAIPDFQLIASGAWVVRSVIESRDEELADRNDNVVPFDRREARRWTRVTDYWPDADPHVASVAWAKPGSIGDHRMPRQLDRPKSLRHRNIFLPLAVLAILLLGVWASVALKPAGNQMVPQTAKSSGLVFGLCNEGGLTNCVVSGDSFYLGGRTVRIARIEAPQLYGAACPKEAALGRQSAVSLQKLLNSGEIEMTKVPQDLDRYGLLLRSVAVDGKDVGHAMISFGLARRIGDIGHNWC
jgi:endonuclease YncB( thermonuclease family)